MLNTQAPEKRVDGGGYSLAVNSIFYTIQGEGPFAGTPAVFVRLAGCNLQCPLCDTEYTRREQVGTLDMVETVQRVAGANCSLVVLTGGEPMRQPVGEFVLRLLVAGWKVQLETNGTLYDPGLPYHHPNLTIVCSPKAGSVHRMLIPWVSAWKYVANADNINPDDGLPQSALDHPCGRGLARPPEGNKAPIYLQPVDYKDAEANERALQAVVAACLNHGHRLCLQMHKIVGVD